MTKENKKELQDRFIKLRVLEGKSFESISKELQISKQTALNWYKELETEINQLKEIPLIKTDNPNTENKIIQLVNNMIELQKKYHSKNTDHEKKIYKNQIDVIDKQIDILVYELYGLNEDDIKVIEDSLK